MIIGQLWHPGRQQLWHPTKSPIGVSDLPDPYSGTVPHVMDKNEVYRVADAYIRTAKRLAQCGFDGIELHGAHQGIRRRHERFLHRSEFALRRIRKPVGQLYIVPC